MSGKRLCVHKRTGTPYVFAHTLPVLKSTVKSVGFLNMHFHDLRHTYAVASIRAGDDIKTISENLGHAPVAFTMDVYAHVTEQMRRTAPSGYRRTSRACRLCLGSKKDTLRGASIRLPFVKGKRIFQNKAKPPTNDLVKPNVGGFYMAGVVIKDIT